MFNPTGIMPTDGPKIVNDVLQAGPPSFFVEGPTAGS
jgi:hypothetical protein